MVGIGAGWLIGDLGGDRGDSGGGTRGTSLAIGIGILHAGDRGAAPGAGGIVSRCWSRWSNFFVRANAYSLVKPLGGAGAAGSAGSAATDGPGAFSGPYVDWQQAALVLVAYLVALLGVSAWVMRRRDVA